MSEFRKLRRRVFRLRAKEAFWLVCWIDSKGRNRKRRFGEWEQYHAWQFYHIVARSGYQVALYEWVSDTWVGRAEWTPCNTLSSNVTSPEVQTFRP